MSSAKASRLWPVSLGARLTLYSAAVTLLISAVLCALLYALLSHSLVREIDAFLEGEITEFHTLMLEHNGEPAEIEHQLRIDLGSRDSRDLEFRLLTVDGKVLVTSDEEDLLAKLWKPPPIAPSTPRATFETVELSGGGAIRVCYRYDFDRNDRPVILQATYDLSRTRRSERLFLRASVAALALAVVLALIGGRLLAKRGLAPIDDMIDAARRIGTLDLTTRVPGSGAGDELDRLARTLNGMLDRVEAQVLRIQQFTADASHELRTPLAALRGSAEVALSVERTAAELRATLADNIEEYDRLSRLAENLLFLARSDAGQHNLLQPMRFRLDTAVADMVDLFEPLAEDRGVALEQLDGKPSWVNGDESRLRQVISNLIDNALKYTPAGGKVVVSVLPPDDTGTVQLSVCDTGVGIDRAHLPHIFDRFYRVDAARTRDAGGAGLGLSICRSIAQAHGGTIEAQSEPGRGTTMIVRLPAG